MVLTDGFMRGLMASYLLFINCYRYVLVEGLRRVGVGVSLNRLSLRQLRTLPRSARSAQERRANWAGT